MEPVKTTTISCKGRPYASRPQRRPRGPRGAVHGAAAAAPGTAEAQGAGPQGAPWARGVARGSRGRSRASGRSKACCISFPHGICFMGFPFIIMGLPYVSLRLPTGFSWVSHGFAIRFPQDLSHVDADHFRGQRVRELWAQLGKSGLWRETSWGSPVNNH